MSVNAINRYINTFKDLNTSNSKKLENKSSQSQLVSTVIESDGIQNNYIQKAIENTKELDESNIIYRIFNFIRKMMPNWQNSRSSLKEKDALSYTNQLIDQLGKTNLSHIIFKDKGFEKKFVIKDGEIEFNKNFKLMSIN